MSYSYYFKGTHYFRKIIHKKMAELKTKNTIRVANELLDNKEKINLQIKKLIGYNQHFSNTICVQFYLLQNFLKIKKNGFFIKKITFLII